MLDPGRNYGLMSGRIHWLVTLRLVIPMSSSQASNVLWRMTGMLAFVSCWIFFKKFARCYFDKIPTGFLTWSPSIKGYKPVLNDESYLSWEPESLPCLNAIREGISKEGYINKLAILWSQESSKDGKDGNNTYTLDVRSDNPLFFKYLGMWSFKSSFYCWFKENLQPRCLATMVWMKFF